MIFNSQKLFSLEHSESVFSSIMHDDVLHYYVQKHSSKEFSFDNYKDTFK